MGTVGEPERNWLRKKQLPRRYSGGRGKALWRSWLESWLCILLAIFLSKKTESLCSVSAKGLKGGIHWRKVLHGSRRNFIFISLPAENGEPLTSPECS